MRLAKPVVVFVGASGSGKTTLVEALAKLPEFRCITTSTSRPPRNAEDSVAYHRDSPEVLLNSDDYVLQAEFAGHAYAVRKSEFIDTGTVLLMTGQPAILKETEILCKSLNRPLIIVHLKKPLATRLSAMEKRGDSADAITQRAQYDRLDDEMAAQPVPATITITRFIEVNELLDLLKDKGV